MAAATNIWLGARLCSFVGTRCIWPSPLSRAAASHLRCYSSFSSSPAAAAARRSLQPPDLPLLAEAARISLTPKEVEDFAPKIRQVIDWFGQLQDVDLESIEPALRADTEVDNSRDDSPKIFENREALLAGVPCYEEPYIKVPKVLNKE